MILGKIKHKKYWNFNSIKYKVKVSLHSSKSNVPDDDRLIAEQTIYVSNVNIHWTWGAKGRFFSSVDFKWEPLTLSELCVFVQR